MTHNHSDAVAPGNVQRATMYQPLLDYFETQIWNANLRDYIRELPKFTHLTATFGVITLQVVHVAAIHDLEGAGGALIYVSDGTHEDADSIAFATEISSDRGFHLVHLQSGLKAQQTTAAIEEERFRRFSGLMEQLSTRWPHLPSTMVAALREREDG